MALLAERERDHVIGEMRGVKRHLFVADGDVIHA
jgi:hypothetical protein